VLKGIISEQLYENLLGFSVELSNSGKILQLQKGFDVHLYGDQGGNYVILGARPFGLHLFFLLEAPRPYDRAQRPFSTI